MAVAPTRRAGPADEDLAEVVIVDPEPGARWSRLDRWAFGLVVAAIACAAAVLWREAETEPFHIDEFRQVRPYGSGWRELFDASFAQEQPPLDVVFGSGFQGVFGVGDVLQRGHSMVAGVVALGCLAVLLWRSGVRLGASVAVLALALLPVFTSFTAYARPYALPLALMLAYLLVVDVWLDRGSWPAAIGVGILALALPLSRVFEPPAFLVLVGASVLFVGWRRGIWGRRAWLPAGAAVVALVAVELPVYLRLQSRLTAYQGESSASLTEQWRRIVDDSLPLFAEVFVNWWFAALLVVVAVAWRPARSRLTAMWWFWPLLLTSVAFAVTFHVRTQPDQPFYDRYGYFWLVPFAVVLAVLTEAVVAVTRDDRRERWPMALATGVVMMMAAYGTQLAVATADDLRTTSRVDFQALGLAVEDRLALDTAVVFDSTGIDPGSFNTNFPPYARYTSPERRVFMAESLIWSPPAADGIGEFVIATNGPLVDVAGWTAVRVSPTMTVYTADATRVGADALGADLVRFGDAHDVAVGTTMRLAGAMILLDTGQTDAGCAALERLLADDPTITSTVRSATNRLDDAARTADCVVGLSD